MSFPIVSHTRVTFQPQTMFIWSHLFCGNHDGNQLPRATFQKRILTAWAPSKRHALPMPTQLMRVFKIKCLLFSGKCHYRSLLALCVAIKW